jgi:cytidylate kinase
MNAADKARTAYVRRLYRTDPTMPSLYHLVIDSTAIALETVVEIILTANGAHAGTKR